MGKYSFRDRSLVQRLASLNSSPLARLRRDRAKRLRTSLQRTFTHVELDIKTEVNVFVGVSQAVLLGPPKAENGRDSSSPLRRRAELCTTKTFTSVGGSSR